MAKRENRAFGADLVIPVLALAFAVYFFFSIADLGWEAKANGVLIGALLVLLIGVQVIRTAVDLARGHGDLGFAPLGAPREAFAKRLGIVAVAAVFIAGMQWLGLTLALFLAMAAALRVLGVRKLSHLLWTPLACAAAAYVMFIAVLNAEFPRGPVEHLLGALF